MQQVRTKLQDQNFPSPSLELRSEGSPPVIPGGSQFKWAAPLDSNHGRSWGHKHLQGAARSGNTSPIADSSLRLAQEERRKVVSPRSPQIPNHSLPWYKVVELVRTEDLLDFFFYFCLVRMQEWEREKKKKYRWDLCQLFLSIATHAYRLELLGVVWHLKAWQDSIQGLCRMIGLGHGQWKRMPCTTSALQLTSLKKTNPQYPNEWQFWSLAPWRQLLREQKKMDPYCWKNLSFCLFYEVV